MFLFGSMAGTWAFWRSRRDLCKMVRIPVTERRKLQHFDEPRTWGIVQGPRGGQRTKRTTVGARP